MSLADHDVRRLDHRPSLVAFLEPKIGHGLVGDGRRNRDALADFNAHMEVVAPFVMSITLPLSWFLALSFIVISSVAGRQESKACTAPAVPIEQPRRKHSGQAAKKAVVRPVGWTRLVEPISIGRKLSVAAPYFAEYSVFGGQGKACQRIPDRPKCKPAGRPKP